MEIELPSGLASPSPSFMASCGAPLAEIELLSVATSSNVRGLSTTQTAEVTVAARLDLEAV